MLKTTWQEVTESVTNTWKKFRAFVRDKFTDEPDLSNLDIDRSYETESDFDDLQNDMHARTNFDIAVDTYVSNRLSSIQKARNNKFREEHDYER